MRQGGTASAAAAAAPTRRARPVILVAGNPNSGKSTLFNALTGAHVKVSNYPGVTVTRTTASLDLPGLGPTELVDLPGTYSLSARSRDEQVAVDAVLGRGGTGPDAVLIVVDATALARNLYFVHEVLETGARVVVALNMIDEAQEQGVEIDVARLSSRLGAPVVPTIARSRRGLDLLRTALTSAIDAPRRMVPTAPLGAETPGDMDAAGGGVGPGGTTAPSGRGLRARCPPVTRGRARGRHGSFCRSMNRRTIWSVSL